MTCRRRKSWSPVPACRTAGASCTTRYAICPTQKSTILFIGYQAKGSLGRAVMDGAETVHIFRRNGPRALQESEYPRIFRARGPAAAPRVDLSHAPFAQKSVRGAGRGAIKRRPCAEDRGRVRRGGRGSYARRNSDIKDMANGKKTDKGELATSY